MAGAGLGMLVLRPATRTGCPRPPTGGCPLTITPGRFGHWRVMVTVTGGTGGFLARLAVSYRP